MAMASNIIPPRGFRFRPPEKEILNHFLWRKNFEADPQVDQFVATLELSKLEPCEIPGVLNMPWEGEEWHFYNARVPVHGKGKQYQRKTKSGFWKSTCEEELIIDSETDKCIGKKRILVYHKDYPPKRTDWVIHEYALNSTLPEQRASFVMCCLKKTAKKRGKKAKSKKAKADVCIPENHEGTHSGFELEISGTPSENAWGHGCAERNYGIFSQPVSMSFDEDEPSRNVTSNGETPPTVSLEVDDYAINSKVSTKPPYSPEGSKDMSPCGLSPIEEFFKNVGNADEGEPSFSVTCDTETSVVGDYAISSKLSTQPLLSPEGHNDLSNWYDLVTTEELLECFVDPDEIIDGKTSDGIFNDLSQKMSSEKFPCSDDPFSWDMETEGVYGLTNLLGPLAT